MQFFFYIFLLYSATADDSIPQEFLSGYNQFVASFHKEVAIKDNENFIVSPLSAEIIWALVHSGASTTTAEEIQSAFHLPENSTKIFKNLLPNLKSDHYTLKSANKIYAAQDLTLKPDFKNIAVSVFDSDIEKVDFGKSSETAEAINKWVEDKTEKKIKNIIDASSLSTNDKAILINAIYFKSKWSTPFKRVLTEDREFFKSESDKVNVSTITKTDRLNYFECPHVNAKFLEIPLRGGASFTVVLPNDITGLAELQKGSIFGGHNFTREVVKVTIPKFKIDYKLELVDLLKKLGVRKAFSADADFGQIADQDLSISDSVQKAFVDVNEDGVEAAAATTIKLIKKTSRDFLVEPKIFLVDRPFLFFIKVKGVVVFNGRVTSPEK